MKVFSVKKNFMTAENDDISDPQGFWNKVFSVLNKGKDKAVSSAKVSSSRLEISALKKERSLAFERLGEEAFKHHKGFVSSLRGLDSFINEIDIINLKIASKDRELKGVGGEISLNESSSEPDRPKHRPERHHRSGEKRYSAPRPPKPDQNESGSDETKSFSRPRKRYYKPRRPNNTNRKEVDSQGGEGEKTGL